MNNPSRIPYCKKASSEPHLANVRQSFRLVYYRSNEGQRWRGKIVHPLTQQQYAFSAGNFKGIIAFTNRFLAADSPDGYFDSNYSAKVKIKATAADFALPMSSKVVIHCHLDASAAEQPCQLEFSAKSMLDGQCVLLEKRAFQSEQEISFQLSGYQLNAGLYRLYVKLKAIPAGASKQDLGEDSRLLLLL